MRCLNVRILLHRSRTVAHRASANIEGNGLCRDDNDLLTQNLGSTNRTWAYFCITATNVATEIRQQVYAEETRAAVQFNSVKDGISALRKAHTVCTPAHLSEAFPTLPLKQFQCSSDWRWPSLVFWWCDVLGFLPEGSVSSSSTFEIFRDESPLVYLLHFERP